MTDVPMLLGAQIEARAGDAAFAGREFLVQGERRWTYGRFRDEAVRCAHFMQRRLGPISDARPGHVAVLLENCPEFAALLGGCAYGGHAFFGVNAGLRGDTLAGVIDHSRARLLIVGETLYPQVESVMDRLTHVAPENVLVVRTAAGEAPDERDFERRLDDEVGPPDRSLDAPAMDFGPDRNLMVIYTSGTTGLPKGINNDHMKLCLSGVGISARLGLGPGDVGYACMPLAHSNSMFMGFMASFWNGASLTLRAGFSASGFLPDVLHHGVTYWNYVGEPVHYVLAAIEREYGGDEELIRAEVTENPANRLRVAIGNGASPPDIDRFTRWLGLDEMFELYGSTEATISTFREKGDPRGSTGEIADPNVKILDDDGRECSPARVDADGRILNYAEAVGEICRIAPDTGLFQGYFDNAEANAQKYRGGIFYSGDMGHVLVRDGRRFLFFDGRTADWIRKDGENFSAAQVGRLLANHPDVVQAVAYGVPCPVSDELVMGALQLREGARFDPRAFFAFCEVQVDRGGMDRKWFPDFVRIVEEFEHTETQKILVRNLKGEHFDRRRLPNVALYWRERGDDAFREFTRADFDGLRITFEEAEKLDLVDR